ncbi:MAG: fasciclin domain-containing protein [candidate division Zixibacteria bacterium]|nr:fasciclin domain-containing protein [candidate division Zixibacteria bacterium]
MTMAGTTADANIVETAVAAGSFNTLVAAVKAAGLVETLSGEGPFTVFAPTDAAFDKLPDGTVEALLNDKEKLTSILTYHVVAGDVRAADVVKMKSAQTVNGQYVSIAAKSGNVMIDNATVVKTDIETSNGVIHVIDEVILPAEDDIVETAMNAGSFNTLVTAVKAAGLVETLQGEGPFTVFAPTDAAFAKLPDGTLESLLNDKAALTQILTYHVVPGRVLASDVVNINTAETANGQTLSIDAGNGGVTINDAKIVQTDIKTSNGVIHVIDAVLLPSERM